MTIAFLAPQAIVPSLAQAKILPRYQLGEGGNVASFIVIIFIYKNDLRKLKTKIIKKPFKNEIRTQNLT